MTTSKSDTLEIGLSGPVTGAIRVVEWVDPSDERKRTWQRQ
jgi:hypothetical protein